MVWDLCVGSLFCGVFLCVISSLQSSCLAEEEKSDCFTSVVLWLSLFWVGLRSVIVAFPSHSHLLFVKKGT